jgi:hypothetical protein
MGGWTIILDVLAPAAIWRLWDTLKAAIMVFQR